MEQRKPKQLVLCCQGNKLLFLLKYLLPELGGKNPSKPKFVLKKKESFRPWKKNVFSDVSVRDVMFAIVNQYISLKAPKVKVTLKGKY